MSLIADATGGRPRREVTADNRHFGEEAQFGGRRTGRDKTRTAQGSGDAPSTACAAVPNRTRDLDEASSIEF